MAPTHWEVVETEPRLRPPCRLRLLSPVTHRPALPPGPRGWVPSSRLPPPTPPGRCPVQLSQARPQDGETVRTTEILIQGPGGPARGPHGRGCR